MAKRRTKDGLNKYQRKWISPPKDRQWAQVPIDVMESKAFRALSVNERRVLDALICQHFRMYQADNGDLQISYSQLEKAGVTRRMIAPSIYGLEHAGLVKRNKGIPRNGLLRRPALYGLPMYYEGETESRRFIFVPLDVMESPGWCKLSLAARRVMDRILIENFRHKRHSRRAREPASRVLDGLPASS